MYLSVEVILKLGGILLTLDGYLNIIYWRWKKEADGKLAQIGRFIRGTTGLAFTLFLDKIIQIAT